MECCILVVVVFVGLLVVGAFRGWLDGPMDSGFWATIFYAIGTERRRRMRADKRRVRAEAEKRRMVAEEADRWLQAFPVAIRLAAVAALVDGSLEDAEVDSINNGIVDWVDWYNARYPHQRGLGHGEMFRYAAKAMEDATHGRIDSQQLERQLSAMDKPLASATMDLCYRVIFADGPAKRIEVDFADRMAIEAGLDKSEIEEIRGRHAPALREAAPRAEPDAAALRELGINPHWGKDRILAHVLNEFGRYSDEVMKTPEGPRREESREHLKRLKEFMD